jgi:gp16 family phage-associated protein
MTTRTADEARAELKRQGVSVSSWAVANGFSTTLVFEVLAGRKKCIRGQAHNIAVRLGLKEGVICNDPAKALDRRAA